MLLLFLTLVAHASELRECRVSVGRVQSCKATAFTGTTPVERPNGRIYDCSVSVGDVGSCPTPHTGDAVLLRGSKLVRCSVASGIVTRCDATGFNGTTVIPHDP